MALRVFSPIISSSLQQRGWDVLGLGSRDGIALIRKINDGLEGSVVKRISEWAKITPTELQKMSGIPITTFKRSTKKRFTANQSERLVRVIRIIERAVALFEGDKEAAKKWLHEPNRALNWNIPAEIVASETGAYEVIRLIVRIEDGVYL